MKVLPSLRPLPAFPSAPWCFNIQQTVLIRIIMRVFHATEDMNLVAFLRGNRSSFVFASTIHTQGLSGLVGRSVCRQNENESSQLNKVININMI